MKTIITASLLLISLASASVAQVEPPSQPRTVGGDKETRKYSKSFRGQDLSGSKFIKENLDNCDFEDANLSSVDFTGSSLKNCNFRGATLTSANFAYADLTGSDFRESELRSVSVFNATLNQVNFEGLDLSSIQLHERKLRGANLRNVKDIWTIYGADFYEADLRGANFSNAQESQPAAFRKAKYDQNTRWHKNFDPKSRGLVYEESKPEETKPAESKLSDMKREESKSAGGSADEFKRLDSNEDGVLSGTEATSSLSKDSNGDREVTLQEFTAGRP